MHENRETSNAPVRAGRLGKANSRNPGMYAGEESDCAAVPVKQPNKEALASAEVVEGRAQTKENDAEPDTSPTLSGERVSQGLSGVRQVAREISRRSLRRHSSKVGAVCGSAARTDLCGGRSAMVVPTATLPACPFREEHGPSRVPPNPNTESHPRTLPFAIPFKIVAAHGHSLARPPGRRT